MQGAGAVSALALRCRALGTRRARPTESGGNPALRVRGAAAISFADISHDGMLTGCNVELTAELARAVPILGRVLCDGRVDPAAALEAARA